MSEELIGALEIERQYGIKRTTLRRRVMYGTFPKPEALVPQTRADGLGGSRKAVWRRATVERALAREPMQPGKWIEEKKLSNRKSVRQD